MIPTGATRYVAPLREGGSLPGIVEADDYGTYVCKFRGAGQGLKVLVAEVIVGELARRLGLNTPALAAVSLDAAIGRYEADEEVQDLLTASVGLNLGVDFLPGSFGFDSGYRPDPQLAARIIWLDAYVANVDRSWRNPNLLVWHKQLFCIDHGAALYFHHGWQDGVTSAERFARQPYAAADHVLGEHRAGVLDADAELAPTVTRDLLVDVLEQVPDEWLEPVPGAEDAGALRASYVDFLLARLTGGARLATEGRGRMKGFQYVVLRCMPRVDREEFVNVGVVLYCQSADFLEAACHVNRERLRALDSDVDLDAVCSALDTVQAVCRGDESTGSAGQTSLGTRFGFVTAPRSTVVQPGPIHGGLTADPARELEHLLTGLVR